MCRRTFPLCFPSNILSLNILTKHLKCNRQCSGSNCLCIHYKYSPKESKWAWQLPRTVLMFVHWIEQWSRQSKNYATRNWYLVSSPLTFCSPHRPLFLVGHWQPSSQYNSLHRRPLRIHLRSSHSHHGVDLPINGSMCLVLGASCCCNSRGLAFFGEGSV